MVKNKLNSVLTTEASSCLKNSSLISRSQLRVSSPLLGRGLLYLKSLDEGGDGGPSPSAMV